MDASKRELQYMKSKDGDRVCQAQANVYLQSDALTIPQSCKCYHPARLPEKDQKPSPDKMEHIQ
jgi:hypothetical protein